MNTEYNNEGQGKEGERIKAEERRRRVKGER